MIIMQMSGGLGNQMFQYAMYLKLKSLGRDVKFDDVTTYKLDNARPVQLAVFDIVYPRATAEEVMLMRDSSPALKDKIRRKLKGRDLKQYVEADYSFDEKIYELDDAYLIGYFQTERYFSDIPDLIRKTYTFRPDLIKEDTLKIESEISACDNSVSIHVRRGDYLKAGAVEVFGGVCTDEYYDSSIQYMLEKSPDAVFYLFTNDQEWADFFVKNHAKAKITVVRTNTEYTGYLDMYLMTRCRHHIVANSSFSWWGAWLGTDPSGITLAPKQWFMNGHCRDVHTDNMVLIDEKGKLINPSQDQRQ